MDIVVLALAGLLSGICASMGLGGGFVLLVYLTLFTQLSQLDAQLTNLVFFLPIAVLSVILHLKNQLIEKKVLLKAIVVGIIGVLIGGFLSGVIEEELLSKLFGGFILLIGLKELFHRKSGKNKQKEEG
ncbi:sulfite exporter TauE/SafE family protein [Massiliimalia massiliensis]|uniref:sulfite exporter TauE/SafE family protein n=1 Tax=Massiliimalia massiliensis TaxID=1852384 RepID=UPI0009868E34|nr:sulfite exporter TauE/SafE family protein [Massiliimalia massiliensis]